jgi:hypothetical protein
MFPFTSLEEDSVSDSLRQICFDANLRMERNGPTLSEVLYEYCVMETALDDAKTCEDVSSRLELVKAVDAMLVKLREYKNEAGDKLVALKASGTYISLYNH